MGALNSQINAPSAKFNGNNNGFVDDQFDGQHLGVDSPLPAPAVSYLGASDALATGAPLNFASSATGYLDLNGKNQTVAGLDVGNSSAI